MNNCEQANGIPISTMDWQRFFVVVQYKPLDKLPFGLRRPLVQIPV
jgi:hypothetical protein